MTDYPAPDARIRLAEFVGWKRIHARTMIPERSGVYGYLPHMSQAQPIPDPLNDHNDCHALIEALHKNGVMMTIWYPFSDQCVVDASRDGYLTESLKQRCPNGDYRTGVVTLALEILDQTKESDT